MYYLLFVNQSIILSKLYIFYEKSSFYVSFLGRFCLGIGGIDANAHMYEIVGGLRAWLLSAVKIFATGSGVAYTHTTPQYFIHDVIGCLI